MRVDQLNPAITSRLEVIHVDAEPREAAISLATRCVGLIVVCDGSGEATCVVSKSDLVRHLASGLVETTVAALMSRPIVSCSPGDDLHSVWETMAAQGLQNLPVLGSGGRPVGILEIRDAMKALFEQEEFQERPLTSYIAGIGYQ
jgi:CBS domain-containing protein